MAERHAAARHALPGRAGVRRLRALVPLALLLCGAQEPPATKRAPLERVVVVGASASAGFGLERDLAAALDATLRGAHAPVQSQANAFFFVDPLHHGPAEIEAARAARPTLLVATDFLFWFGYGIVNERGETLASEAERLALLAKGLALLEGFTCPVVVGDFPDCSRAIGKMLFEAQVPRTETLAALNRALADWAATRPNVIVLPLARGVASSFAVGAETAERGIDLLGWTYGADASTVLFQADELHPTVEGLALLAHLAAHELVRRGVVRETDVELAREPVLLRLRAAVATPALLAPGR